MMRRRRAPRPVVASLASLPVVASLASLASLASIVVGLGAGRAAHAAEGVEKKTEAAPAAPAAPATPAPAPRPVALYVSGCAGVSDEGVRRIVAVELGPRLIASGSPVPAKVDRLLVSCRGQVARLEAGDPAGPRYAERTLALGQFPADGGTRAVALAALELLNALDRPRAPAPSAAAEDQYQQNFVWFYDAVVLAWNGRKWVPYRGKYHEPLAGADFYDAIDRPDLASSYRARKAVHITMIIAGIAASIYGLGIANDHGGLAAGLLLGGAVVMGWGLFGSEEPVDEPEARQLADEHNRRLKRRLGLPDQPDRNPSPQPVMQGWHVTGIVTPRGGGALALTLDF